MPHTEHGEMREAAALMLCFFLLCFLLHDAQCSGAPQH